MRQAKASSSRQRRYTRLSIALLLQLLPVWHSAASAVSQRALREQPLRSSTESSQDDRNKAHSWRHASRPKLYVIDSLPAKYVQGATGAPVPERSGYGALGQLLSVEHHLWNTWWHSIDLWFAYQLHTSPLKTYNATEADAIFVPAALSIQDVASQNDFIENAPALFPLLQQKPHLLVLNHAALTYMQLKSELLTHPNSQRFTFITINPRSPGLSSANLVSAPYFFHQHHSRGSRAAQLAEIPDAETLGQQKSIFAVESFSVRMPERQALHRACVARPESCMHLTYDKMEDAVKVYEAMQKAWYGLHPRGDFLNRGAFYDTCLATAIPVIFDQEYHETLPFTDRIDYNQVTELVSLDLISANSSQNVIDFLKDAFDPPAAIQKLLYISEIKHVFSYMLDPMHEAIRFDQLDQLTDEDDAFTMTMKEAFANMCRRDMLPMSRCAI